MKILAITINFRTPDMTMDAVRALVPDLEGIPSKVVIVDNDSQDGSMEKMQAQLDAEDWGDQVVLLDSGHNGGFGYGNNCGMRLGFASDDPPEYVYLLNSDAFPDPGAVPTLLEFLENKPSAGIAGSYVHGEDGTPHITAFRFLNALGEFESNLRFGPVSKLLQNSVVPMIPVPSETCEVDWVAGASMLMRSEMLHEIGLFDETFFLYFEETDLCFRAKKHGWETWFVPTASVAHIGSATTGAYSMDKRRPTYWFDSRHYFYEKNYGKAYAHLADAAWLAGQALWKVRRTLERKPRRDPKHIARDFLAHKLGLPRAGS